MDEKMSDRRRRIIETTDSADDSIHQVMKEKDSSGSDVRAAMEMVIVIRSSEEDEAWVSGENRDLIHSDTVSKVLEDEMKIKDLKDGKNSSCVIDVKGGAAGSGGVVVENRDGEWVCRICHLSSDQSLDTASTSKKTELIQLGCGCKDDLGIAHPHCAEAWFKLKGNRLCEICGKAAENITGVGDNRFMEVWNDRRASGIGIPSERSGGCWRGQPFCNFLMACLVIAFVLPWFFRVNMF